jgi:long-chain fatty acid transport protein
MYRRIGPFIIAALFTANVYAGGFQINEHGARAMAMGGAFAGLANDPSALYFNPAGITQLSGTNFMTGVTLILPKSSFRGPSPTITQYDMKSQVFNPINFYGTYQYNNELYFGVSVNNQYGLGTLWDDNWAGNQLAVKTDLKTFFFNAVAAYKLSDKFSVSGGFVYALGTVELSRYTGFEPFTGTAKVSLKGDGSAFGFTAGLLYKPIPELSFGLSFRSQAKFSLSGDANSEGGPAAVQSLLPKGKISSEITTPMNITFGVAAKPVSGLTVTADFQYVGWSSYDKLTVDFADPKLEDLSSYRGYENTYIIRFGAEYQLIDKLALRGGLLYDKNPVKDELLDPTLPDADRLGFSAGFGYKLAQNFSVDIAYLFLRFAERTITNSQQSYTWGNAPFNGTYNSTAHLIGFNLSYNF